MRALKEDIIDSIGRVDPLPQSESCSSYLDVSMKFIARCVPIETRVHGGRANEIRFKMCIN